LKSMAINCEATMQHSLVQVAKPLLGESEVTELLMSNSTSAARAFCQPEMVSMVLKAHMGMACGRGGASTCAAACDILPVYKTIFRSQVKHCVASSIDSLKDLFHIYYYGFAINAFMDKNCGCDDELAYMSSHVFQPELGQCLAFAESTYGSYRDGCTDASNDVRELCRSWTQHCKCIYNSQFVDLYTELSRRPACGPDLAGEVEWYKAAQHLTCLADAPAPAPEPLPCPQLDSLAHWREQVLVPEMHQCMASASSTKDIDACICVFYGQMVARYTELSEREACGTMYDQPLEKLKSMAINCEATMQHSLAPSLDA